MYNYFKFSIRKVFPLLLFFLTNCYVSIAQNYPSDCSEAYQICNLGDYHFPNIRGYGSQENLHLNESKIKETNSIWLQFLVEEEGELEFVIIPDNQEDDIDFVLYQGNKCSSISPLRVMTSGQIIGDEFINDCVGQTGLRNSADDIKENDGCFDAADNFLKSVGLKKGEKYYLFVNNFNSSKGFSILFSGDENLKLIDKCNNSISFVDIKVYPNPAVDKVIISSETKIIDPVEIKVIDLSGRILLKRSFKNMMADKQIDVSDIPSGEYYFQIISKEYTGLKPLVKI